MDMLGLGKVHWAGLSTGGRIAQGLAIHHPDRIASLSLCHTFAQVEEVHHQGIIDRQEIVKTQGMLAAWDLSQGTWFTDSFVDAANADYQILRQIFIETPIPGYLGATTAVLGHPYRDFLHKITAPTNIIAADDDLVTPVEFAYEMAERIKGSRLTVIEGQRHFSNVEVPERFNEILRRGSRPYGRWLGTKTGARPIFGLLSRRYRATRAGDGAERSFEFFFTTAQQAGLESKLRWVFGLVMVTPSHVRVGSFSAFRRRHSGRPIMRAQRSPAPKHLFHRRWCRAGTRGAGSSEPARRPTA